MFISVSCGPKPVAPDTADGFRSVVAQVRGITWPACAATMEVALRRRLAGVAEVSISQQQQTAVVTFLPDTRVFSAAEFRAAVAEADVEVIRLDVRVCGLVDADGALRPAASGDDPLVRLQGDVRPGRSVCATGHLDDRTAPYILEVVNSQPRS